MTPDPVISECRTAEDLAEVEAVTRAHVHWLDIDLGFQDIHREMEDFTGMYGPRRELACWHGWSAGLSAASDCGRWSRESAR